MHSNRLLPSVILVAILGGGLVACGGDSSSTSTSTSTPSLVEISGTAMAPGGDVAMFEQQGALYALIGFLIPSASAAITGLEPVTGATVELIYVDDEGVQVGEVLASTTTSITGQYQLSLPSGVDFAANLVVRIRGMSGFTMDAQVVTQTVDIDPYSDFLLDRLIANGTQLATLATNQVVLLKGKLDEFDLTAGADMTEMLASLNAMSGQYLDESIAIAVSGTGDAIDVAGDYHYGEFALALHDNEAATFGTFSASVILGDISISSQGGSDISGALTATRVDASYNLGFYNGGASLFVSNEIEDSTELAGMVDAANGINIEWGFEEDISGVSEYPYGWRYPAGTLRMIPVGTAGIYLASINEAGVRYELDANGAVDPNAQDGDEVSYSLLLSARKGSGLDATALDGSYGTVGMVVDASDDGSTEVGAFHGVMAFDGHASANDLSFDKAILGRLPNSAPVASTDTTLASMSYTVGADGSLVLTEGGNTNHGFVADNGNVWATFAQDTIDDGGMPATITHAEHSMAIGVKLPDTQPAMNGSRYQIRNLMLGYAGTGTIISMLSNATISFNGDGTINIDAIALRGVERVSDTASLEPVADAVGAWGASQPVTVGTDGSIDVTAINDGDGQLKLDGFVSADKGLLILRATWIEAGGRDVGVFIGALNSQ